MGIAWHAPYELLKPETQDLSRAIHSLMEELEAIDWYGQRMDVTQDDALRAVLEHNRDEEKEHAAMLIEWIRRRDPKFDQALHVYLFTSGDLMALEDLAKFDAPPELQLPPAEAQQTDNGAMTDDKEQQSLPSLTVGSLRPRRG
jgi:uncharacterized protein